MVVEDAMRITFTQSKKVGWCSFIGYLTLMTSS
jgi:hypothetical protein